MPHWYASLNLAIIAFVTIAIAVTLSVATLLAVRRWVLPRMHITETDGEFAGAMVQAILVFYALAVALVAVGSWDRHSQLNDQVSTEAAAVATLYRESQLYPEPVRTDVQTEIEAYVHYIIDEAWPQQERGVVPTGGLDHINAIQKALGAYEPTTNGQQAVHAQVLSTFERVIELRRLRLDAVSGHLSLAMWVFVVGGGALATASAFFFKVTDWKLHATMVGLLATFIAMVVILITAFDQPFTGSLRVGPDSFRLILDTIAAR